MHLGQALILDAQLDAAGRIDLDDVDKLPGDAAGVQLARDPLQGSARQQALEDPAEGTAHAHLDLGHAQQVSSALAHPLEIHIVDADHFAAVNVDDLAVDQILLEIEVITLVLERHQGAGRTQLEGSGRGFHHVLRRNDAEAGAGFEHQTGPLCPHRDRWPRRCP